MNSFNTSLLWQSQSITTLYHNAAPHLSGAHLTISGGRVQ